MQSITLPNDKSIIETADKIKYEKIEKAAKELLWDVYKKHPGEKLRCPFMIELQRCLDLL